MNTLTFLAMTTGLCGLLNIGTIYTQDVANFGFGVELILAKLEGLENRMMMLEQHMNSSLEAMLTSHCSPQPGRLSFNNPTNGAAGDRYPNSPERPSRFYNPPGGLGFNNTTNGAAGDRYPNDPEIPPWFYNRPASSEHADRRSDNSGSSYTHFRNESYTYYGNGHKSTPRPTRGQKPIQQSMDDHLGRSYSNVPTGPHNGTPRPMRGPVPIQQTLDDLLRRVPSNFPAGRNIP